MRKFFCSLALLAVTFPISSSDPNAAQHSDVAFLGVHHEAPSPDAIDQNHLDAYQGVEVTDVFSNSAAESMGIQEGDVILAINGVPIANGMDLRKEITSNLEGDPVSAVVRRKGEDIELNGEFGGMSGGAMRQDLNYKINDCNDNGKR
jgi:S1-C subfamily serine protease